MSVKSLENHYNQVVAQYQEMLADLKDMEKELAEGLVSPDFIDNLKANIAPIKQNYEWWTYGKEAVLWTSGAKYTFNAYFPKDAIEILPSYGRLNGNLCFNWQRQQKDTKMRRLSQALAFCYKIQIQLNEIYIFFQIEILTTLQIYVFTLNYPNFPD